MHHRRACVVAGVVAVLAATMAIAQTRNTYPSKPIRVLVGFAPGGGSDILSRAVGQKLAERWGQPVVTDNRAGAGGTIALELAARAAPDGYTLLVISGSQITNATLVTKVPFDIRVAYAPITQMTSQPYVLLEHPSVPAKSVKELIAYAKANAGKLNYASSGTGSSAHLGMELFKSLAHVDMVHVPYKGSGQALIDLLGGQVQLLLASAISAGPHLKTGKLRALGVTSARRSPHLPDLPAIAEVVPGFDVTGWYGLVAPAGTAPAIVAALNREVAQILRTADLQEKLAADGTDAAPGSPAQFKTTIVQEIEKWTGLVRTVGVKL
ncbi:MAG TPA: tripartite tricarboxylate transporter substrate binding protein [Burkholderiales bacterium]|nr:tripartite tricarboxylate transporter substrate binding protein [Burkholderiales bacterium]